MSTSFPTTDPTWDLDSIFDGGTESEAFETEVEVLEEALEKLETQQRRLELPAEGEDVDSILDDWRQFLDQYFSISDRIGEAGSFARCLAAAHANDPQALRMPSQLDDAQTALQQVDVALKELFHDVDDNRFEYFESDERFSDARLWLAELRRDADRSMEPGQEQLAVDLNRDGLHAWGRLYSEVTGRLDVEVEIDGELQERSVAQAKNLMTDSSREVRRAAHDGLQQAWGEAAPVCASALNSICGSRQTLYERRGNDCLTEALDSNRVQRSTLDAMFGAAEQFRDVLQRYLEAKARYLGVDRLQWYDLSAPVGDEDNDIAYTDAQQFIVDQVQRYSPEIASFCRQALARQWVEAEDRSGKRQGGYCTTLPVSGQIRIFMTFGGNSSGVTTLAHELGHGYHGHVMRDLPGSQRKLPMGLAETASTLLEVIVEQAALREASGGRKLALLDGRLQRAMAFLVNIPARFELEKRMHKLRADGRLHEELLSEVTTEIFEDAYGAAVDSVDPLYWAAKLHFFLTRMPFYNFPYTFGYLFSREVYRRVKSGSDFTGDLDAMLRDTGRMQSEALAAKHLDADLGDQSFWKGAAGPLEEDVETFEALVSEMM